METMNESNKIYLSTLTLISTCIYSKILITIEIQWLEDLGDCGNLL